MVTKQEELATKKDLKKLEDALTTKLDANAAKIDANSTKIDRVEKTLGAKIDANNAKIDHVEETLGAKIDANAAKIDQVEKNLSAKIDTNSEAISRLTSLALENKDEIKKMAKQEDMDKRLDEIVSAIDGLARSFSILGQERIATTARVDRIEADVRENKTKIRELEAKVAR